MENLAGLQQEWEPLFERFLSEQPGGDPGHGIVHVRRVVATATRLCVAEGARGEVVLPAAWLHDCVHVAKDSKERSGASRAAAARAVEYLAEMGYPSGCLPGIRHAIEAHSFSAGIAPRTIEARIVQDADRLDALGAIGIARCIAVGAALDRPIYWPEDPFCVTRAPNEAGSSVDHFYTKLLKLADTMQTEAGRREARRRSDYMQGYLDQLRSEIG
jgi:uncharacterized protein